MAAGLAAACGGGTDDGGEPPATSAATSAPAETEAPAETTEAASDEPVQLGVFLLAAANTYSQANLEGAQQAADEAGDVTVQVFDGGFDPSKQVKQIEDALATGNFDAFVVFPNNGGLVAVVAEEAGAAGVPVVSASAPIGPDIEVGAPQVEGVIGTVWHANRENGVDLGELTIEACKQEHADSDPCKVAFITGGKAIGFEQTKVKAFEETVAAADIAVDVVSVQEAGFLQEPALNAMQNILQANPDLDVIVSSGDQMTLGAEQAVDDAGLTGKVTLIGNGATVQAVQALKDGTWFASPVYLPRTEGLLAAQMAIDAARGTSPAATEVDWIDLSPVGPILTPENAGSFEAEWSG